ncbi:hypothetical protein BDN72DRAFT_895436 [Pluteus cervinus]|uniref:Uncharacterized protein n=1 Tax=Pluteus cervinus TaxID=181527 RepID=A0ACD3B1S0_9AGAR|nr:hypothetical protein BDN72DRAFT_895436 [Pluteus cervinus]
MAVLAPADWQHYPPRDTTMDGPANNSRQRSSPASDPSNIQAASHHQQHHHPHQPQQLSQQPYTYPLQQQPQGGWTPSIAAQPFYPAFYQNPQQQHSPQFHPSQLPPQAPFYDPTNAQLWAYQQMLFNQVQQGFGHLPHLNPQQRPPPNASSPADFYAQNQINFSPFPSGTPPPQRGGGDSQAQGQQQNPQYAGFHPYRRPSRQPSQASESNDWRPGPYPPYARPDASGSSTSLNSSGSHRQRTNSNQSGNSGHNPPSINGHSRPRNASPASVPNPSRGSPSSGSPSGSPAPPPLRAPHHRNASSSSSASTSTASRSTPLSPSLSTTTASSSTSSPVSNTPSSSIPRPARPSPLSQGTFTAAEKRMSRDDSDLAAMRETAPMAGMSRSGGLKGRLRRALSFNSAQVLQEEEEEAASIKASATSKPNSLNTNMPTGSGGGVRSPESGTDDTASTATVQTKKRGRAASLFNSRLNASTDNISLSSTVSSASVMIRKLGSMGKLARRNSLAGITSLFKNKDKEDKKGKKEKGTAKAEVSEASVSHVTAELDRGGSSDWSVGAEMTGLSPAAKLARQHTLKTNAEAAARAKAQQEAQAAPADAVASSSSSAANGDASGAGVAVWDRNTATRQGVNSPAKPGVQVNEDGTRVLVEDEEEEESDDGHYGGPQQAGQGFHADGWDDDEDWDTGEDQEGDEDMTIRVGIERTSLDSAGYGFSYQDEPEPWATDIRRSVERAKMPAKGILKNADKYDQSSYLGDTPTPNRARSNSYNSHGGTSELGPLARMPSPDPDHIDGLHRHGSHSSSHGPASSPISPLIPPLPFEEGKTSRLSVSLEPKEAPETPTTPSTSFTEKTSSMFTHPNSSAPVLSTMTGPSPPTLTHRSATAPSKRLAFASNLSVYDTFPPSVYDRRSEPATWSRLTPALAQRIKEELNSYKMEEMEVHASSRIHTQFFV